MERGVLLTVALLGVCLFLVGGVSTLSIDFIGVLESGSSSSNNWIYVNVSALDAVNNVSVFIDFDNSLVGWWRAEPTVSILSISDIQDPSLTVSGTSFNNTLVALSKKYDYAFLLGDLASEGYQEAQYSAINNSISTRSNYSNWFFVPGNHDAREDTGLSNYSKYFGSYKWNKTIGNMMVIGIGEWMEPGDSNFYTLNSTDMAWLNKTVAENQDKLVVILTHHPVYNTNINSIVMYLEPRDQIQTMLDTYNVSLWVHGHVHRNPGEGEYVVQKNETIFINDLGIHVYAKTPPAANSLILKFTNNSDILFIDTRDETSGVYSVLNSYNKIYKMDKAFLGGSSVDNAPDYSTYGRAGVLVGDTHINSSGSIGSSFDFDGVGDYIETADSPFDFTGNFSISAWIYPRAVSAGQQAIVAKAEAGGYVLQINGSGYATFSAYSGGYKIASSNNVLSNNNWYHLTAIVNGSEVSIFVNGVKQATTGNLGGGSISTINFNLTIGIDSGSPYAFPFNGLIDDVMIFNRSLSAAEITALYANTSLKNLEVNFTGLSEGLHSFRAFLESASGGMNYTVLSNNTLGYNAPVLTIASPFNNSNWNSASINFNTSLNKAGSWCGFSLDGAENVSMTGASSTLFNYFKTGLSEGLHNLVFSCNDTFGLFSSSSLNYFLVDTIFPSLIFESPTPQNNSIQKNNNIYVNVSASDSNNISTFIDFNNSLIGWWRMDDVDGSGNPIDYTGRYNGTKVGGAVQTNAGYFGKGFSFDGDGDYISGTAITFRDEITVSAWVYAVNLTSTVGGEMSNHKAVFTANANILSDKIQFAAWNNLNYDISYWDTNNAWRRTTGGPAVTINQWYHLVWVVKGSNYVRIYRDGVNVINYTLINPLPTTTSNFWIGTSSVISTYPQYFNGTIDDVMVFNRSLNSDEISALYANNSEKRLGVNFTNLQNQTYTFKAYSQDIGGNVNLTGLSDVYISDDTTPPNIIILSPSAQNYTTTTIDFDISSNENLSSCLVSFNDFAANYTMTLNSSLTGANHTNSSMSQGSITAKFWCNDSAGNVNNTEEITFFIDSTYPQINITYPQNTTYLVNVSVLNYTFTEANPNKCWWSNNSGIWNSTAINCGTNWTGLTSKEGSNTWTVYINDTAGNFNSSNITFTKDTIVPVITITSPLNQTYNTSQILINFTADSYQNLWYYNGTANRSYSTPETITVPEGSNTFIFYANDTAGNLNSSSVTFFKDTIVPLVTINSPTATTYTTSSILFNVTLDENGTCLYSTNAGTTNTSLDTTDNLIFTKTLSLTDGSYIANFYCNDSVGNRNDTMNISFSVAIPVAETPASSSGGGLPTYYPTESNLQQGYEIALATHFQIKFNLGGNLHTMKVNNLTNDSVNITISSEPITLILNVEDTQKVDVNSDGYYDISIFLKSISGNKANLVITSIYEVYEQNNELSTNAETGNGVKSPTGPIQNGFRNKIFLYSITAVGIIILLALVVLGFFLWVLKKRQSA